MSEAKTASGIRPFNSLRKKKNSEYKILLVLSFGELKGDLTGSSNSKSFSVEKIQELIRNNATITVIQPTSSYNMQLDWILQFRAVLTQCKQRDGKKLTFIRQEVSSANT
jgi:hypothetical protein